MILVTILSVLLLFVCIALVGLILIQQGKGGGLTAFGGGGVEQAFGTHAATLAQKATATLAVLFLVLAVVLGKLYQGSMMPPAGEPEAPSGEGAPAVPSAPAEIPQAPAEAE